MESVRRVQILAVAVCIRLHTIALGRGIDQSIFSLSLSLSLSPCAMSKLVGHWEL